MDFYFESAFSGRDKKSADDKKIIAAILLPVIKRIPDNIIQAHWVSELARKFSVKEEIIEQELKKVKLEEYPKALGLEEKEVKALPIKSRRELLEERLAILILKDPRQIDLLANVLAELSEPIRDVLEKVKKQEKVESDFYDYLALRADLEEIEPTDIMDEIKCCLREIANMDLKNKLNEISQQIMEAEEKKDNQKIEQLTKEFNQLAKQKCQN